MLQFTPLDAIKAVRKNLDEQGWNPSAMFGESADNGELDDTIRKTIPEAIDAVHLAAPVDMLESCEGSFTEDGVNDGVLDFHTGKPVLRLVGVKAADSDTVLASSFTESSPIGRLQSNHYLRGTHKDPILVKRNGSRDRFRYFTVGSRTVRNARRIADYLYEKSYDALDYGYAKNYFESRSPYIPVGACSSVRNGNWYGRNYDWNYNEDVEFVVRTKAEGDRHATIGIASGVNGLSKEAIRNGADADLYRILPFYLLDGINDAGLFCNMNVVSADQGRSEYILAQDGEEDRICTLMLVRYILDNFTSALEALNYIQDHVSLFNPPSLMDMDYELHFMVGDASGATYILEIYDGEVVFLPGEAMTNFYIYGVQFNTGGTVYTPADAPTHTAHYENHVNLYGSGLERFNIIAGNQTSGSKSGMRSLMNSLLFTNAYKDATDPFWYSEFVGPATYDVDTPITDSAVTRVVAIAKENYINRDRRNPNTWHTAHSCVYDIAGKRIFIVSQEDTAHEYTARLTDTVPETHLERVEYVTYAQVADSYEVGSALLTPVIDQLTAMVLAIYGEADKAQYFFQKANIQQ